MIAAERLPAPEPFLSLVGRKAHPGKGIEGHTAEVNGIDGIRCQDQAGQLGQERVVTLQPQRGVPVVGTRAGTVALAGPGSVVAGVDSSTDDRGAGSLTHRRPIKIVAVYQTRLASSHFSLLIEGLRFLFFGS
jgi:hypothetical protein